MFQGSMVALVTPMREDGPVDYEALQRLVDFHVDNNTNAIISVGTTGESATLDPDEHCQVIERTIQFVNGRIPVIAGTGANSTAEAIYFTRRAHEMGADACLLVTPYYNKPTQEGLYQHFKAIAEAVPINQILYNVPGRTACDMLTPVVNRLAEIENIIGIKDASADITRADELVQACSDRMSVIVSGEDGNALEHMRRGGKGVISVTANVAPKQMSEMCSAALSGDFGTAGELNDALADLHKALFFESNPIPVKWAVQQLGLIGGHIRLPLTPLSSQYHDQVRAAMVKAGVL
ncbi:MAG: 4-hydroxy-tetrahydrodipicolinate synthase [Arenicellales bacterium]|nr:4-hydroxy-tetrahydrodipicolinate synthase [Arenicellales bacterium]